MKKILLVVLFIMSSTGVLACAISPFDAIVSNSDKFFENADVVFYGEVMDLSTKGEYTQVAEFHVTKTFKGGEYNKVTIENKMHTTCSRPFDGKGNKYIVFAKRGSFENTLHINGYATFVPMILSEEVELKLDEINFALNIPKIFLRSRAFKIINYKTKSVGEKPLRTLRVDPDSLEVRIWIGFGLMNNLEGYIFKKKHTGWEFYHLPLFEQPELMYKLNEPKSGSEAFWSKISKEGILSLPDSSELKNPAFVVDGGSYVVELLTNKEYRTYHYSNPEYQKWPEAKKLLSIIKIIRDEFELRARDDKTSGMLQCKSDTQLSDDRETINKLIENSTQCNTKSDCVIVDLGCPFGCGTGVNIDSKEQVVSLVDKYHAESCYDCENLCNSANTVECVQNKCVVPHIPVSVE